jgi:dipeptidase D
MSYSVANLEPKVLWRYFDEIRKIPHGSGNEKALGEAIMGWAKEKGCEAAVDKKGNVIVRIPATPGKENAPTVVLQGHIDMVCEKNSDKVFDFTKDSISLVRDGDWIKADGTTLGADNGIGAAVGLAFLEDKSSEHGPLELLLTVEEEIGLFGASALEPGFVKGRLLFNLDSEEDGVFYVGCAGGRDTHMNLPLARDKAPGDHSCFTVEVKGLRGGHSGLDIIHNRGNAIRLLGRAIDRARGDIDLRVVSLEGGDKHNAIPREAKAVITVKKGSEDTLRGIFANSLEGFRDEFASAEPELSLTVTTCPMPTEVLGAATTKSVLALVLGIPHGVLAMVRGMDGMVETSSNLARVRTEADTFAILCSSRSSVASALDGVIAQLRSVGESCGAQVNTNPGYPGWKPNLDSTMLAKAKEAWRAMEGKDAKFQVIHAGLECGIIGERYPGMDMISLGPTIQNPHSPDECVSISSVERFYNFVRAFLTALANN